MLSEVIIQPAPMSCIQLPMLDASEAIHSERYSGVFSGAHGDASSIARTRRRRRAGRRRRRAYLQQRVNDADQQAGYQGNNVHLHSHGCAHAAHQLQVGINAAAPRYSDFWGLGCDCFAF